MTSYHKKTTQILGQIQHESKAALSLVEDAEKRLGIQLPPSVREWYSYPDALEILAAHSNDDPPIPIGNFVLDQWHSDRLLLFKDENQGVCVWSILLDDSDDPPVYVNVDGNGWCMQTSRFSDYVYSCVWDYAVVFSKLASVQAQNKPVSDLTLSTLATKFSEEVRTYGWPDTTQFRFYGDRQAILIWSAEDQADCFVGGDDAAALRSLLRTVWLLDDVGQSFYDCSEIGKKVLEELKK